MPKGIYKNHKEATRKRIESRRKNGWNKNPEYTKLKKREAMVGKHWKIKDTSKMSEAKKGHKVLKETREKIGLANSVKLKGNQNALGHKVTKEAKEKMSCNGDKNGNWKGGLSFELYSIDWTETLKRSIRERDHYICQLCGIHQDELIGWNKKLDCHHIDYDKDNLNPENLISLCRSCHIKTNYDRNYWKEYFFKNL